jgi:hypothetical protein
MRKPGGDYLILKFYQPKVGGSVSFSLSNGTLLAVRGSDACVHDFLESIYRAHRLHRCLVMEISGISDKKSVTTSGLRGEWKGHPWGWDCTPSPAASSAFSDAA